MTWCESTPLLCSIEKEHTLNGQDDISALTFIPSSSILWSSHIKNSPVHDSHVIFTVRSCGGINSVQKHLLHSVQLTRERPSSCLPLSPLKRLFISFSPCVALHFQCFSDGLDSAITNTLLPRLHFSKSQEHTTQITSEKEDLLKSLGSKCYLILYGS